jgi:hypothetical protein
MSWECGCDGRRTALNAWIPGLGDKVATIAEPVKELAPYFAFGALLGLLGGVK